MIYLQLIANLSAISTFYNQPVICSNVNPMIEIVNLSQYSRVIFQSEYFPSYYAPFTNCNLKFASNNTQFRLRLQFFFFSIATNSSVTISAGNGTQMYEYLS